MDCCGRFCSTLACQIVLLEELTGVGLHTENFTKFLPTRNRETYLCKSLHYSIPSIEELSKPSSGHRADGLRLHLWILLVSPENKFTRRWQQWVLSLYLPSTYFQTSWLGQSELLVGGQGRLVIPDIMRHFCPFEIRRNIWACLRVSNTRYCPGHRAV